MLSKPKDGGPGSGDRVPSGVADVDALLGGLILGDNVVWVLDDVQAVRRLEDALVAEVTGRGERCFYVTASDPARLQARLGPLVTVLDARPRGPYGDAAVLETAVIEGARNNPPGYVIIDGLMQFARRWGPAKAVAFFSRVCPRLFDLGAVAYWRAPRADLGRAFIEQVTNVTQCVLEIGDGSLRVVKAEGRPASVQGRLLRLDLAEDGEVRLEDERALGRLGRGLERVRRERNLSQSELARLAGITPSAISQAEAGRRGLSLDTLLLLSERLGMGLDELLASAPTGGYVLARHPRTSVEPTTALLDDPKAGLRAYLVRLGPGEAGAPDLVHKGPELVLVASGLVQLTVGSDTPVMRAGDALLATSFAVSGWRNLMNAPALLFWVLRDETPKRK